MGRKILSDDPRVKFYSFKFLNFYEATVIMRSKIWFKVKWGERTDE